MGFVLLRIYAWNSLAVQGAALWWPIGALVAGSAIAIYYYLRAVFAMTGSTEEVAALPGCASASIW